MNTRPWLCAAVAAALVSTTAPFARAQEVFDLDPAHFSIVFSVSHNNMSYTYGMFRQAQGRVVLDRTDPARCQFQLTINADSIDTNNVQRDNHLKSPDFLNAAQFPTITFASTACSLDNQQGMVKYLVTGNLTMHGVTREVTLPIQMLGEGPGAGGRGYSAGFITQVELKRSDFGMSNLTNVVGDAIGITVSFETIRQDGAAPPRQ
jgi:polyisoprenoid-binding protein YceI